jgi:hypothetical protein
MAVHNEQGDHRSFMNSARTTMRLGFNQHVQGDLTRLRPKCRLFWRHPGCQLLIGAVLSFVWLTSTLAAQESSRPDVPYIMAADSVTYIYGPNYQTPFVVTPSSPGGANIARNTLEWIHHDNWRYGSNLLDLSLRKSSSIEPAVGGGTGALEPYLVLRSGLALHSMLGQRMPLPPALRDISIEGGVNLESKNSAFAPEERTIYIGPVLQFKVPRGVLNVGVHFRKEWNHEGILGKDESYDPDLNIEPLWNLPVRVGHVELGWGGFADINTPKGKDSFGTQMQTEVLARSQLMVDLGTLVHREKTGVELGGGLEYWHNEYGKPANITPGADELTPLLLVRVHLPGGRF